MRYKDQLYHYSFDHRLHFDLHWRYFVVEHHVNDDDEGQQKVDLLVELQMEVLVNDDEAKNV